MADHRGARVSQGGEGVPRRKPTPPPKAPPATPDDWRVEQLLRLYPDYGARHWVQSQVGWQRRSDALEAEVVSLRAQLEERDRVYALALTVAARWRGSKNVSGTVSPGAKLRHILCFEESLKELEDRVRAALPSTDETETT